MTNSRRNFLKTVAASTALPVISTAFAESQGFEVTEREITGLFAPLPGDKAIKIYAPGTSNGPPLHIRLNSNKLLFAASAIKTFVLCETLRQADSPEVARTLEGTALALNDSVWSYGSPSFDPPNLEGKVSARTTLEAMITRSDNTATDMAFKVAGVDNVRAFIAAAGLTNTLVPDSTRAFAAYLFGAKNYKNTSWTELQRLLQEGHLEHPFLNEVQTLASTADDFVSYYSRALQGEFFTCAETLNEFRRILTLCDFIYLVPLPLGVSAYAKSGNADFPGFHARTIAGGIFVSGRWVYFAFLINWYAESLDDPNAVDQFFAAVNLTLTRIRDWFSA